MSTLAIQVGVENPAAATLTARSRRFTGWRSRSPRRSHPSTGDSASVTLAIPEPKLWWVHGMGEQPLYDVHVQLVDADGSGGR